MNRPSRILPLAGALALLLAACSSTPDKPKPTPLEMPAPAEVRPQALWSQRIGSIGVPLQIAAAGSTLAVASGDGQVQVYALDSGQSLWRASAGGPLAAGVGSDGRFVAAVTRGNELVVLRAGEVLWRKRLPARVITAPLVAGERVFVYAQDRAVHAFDAEDGALLWHQQRPADPLTLSEPGVLLAVGNTLVVGQGPRLAGLEPLEGRLRWEVPVAAPRGTNEVERLADLVGPVGRVGEQVCVRAFQAAVGCVDTRIGSLDWSKPSVGATGVTADASWVFGGDATDRITAYRRDSGDTAWTSDRLRYRELSAPVLSGRSVVFGDLQGQLHLLAREDGTPLGRVATDGSPVVSLATPREDLLVALTRAGGLHVYRTE